MFTVLVAFCLICSMCTLHFSLVSIVTPRELQVSLRFTSPHAVRMVVLVSMLMRDLVSV